MPVHRGQVGSRPPQVTIGGIEVAAQPCHRPKQGLNRRAEPLSTLEARAQDLDHFGRAAQVGTYEVVVPHGGECREQLVVAQVGLTQLQASLEVGSSLPALIALSAKLRNPRSRRSAVSRRSRSVHRVAWFSCASATVR
jgi:hypothetical protein